MEGKDIEVWRNDYLLNLRERSQIKMKAARIESHKSPNIGDIVQVKDNIPRGAWKIGRIKGLLFNKEGHVRAANVMLPNKRSINRPLKLLYPLECDDIDSKDTNISREMNNDGTNRVDKDTHPNTGVRIKKNDSDSNTQRRRSSRKAAEEAKDRIFGQILTDEWDN